MMENGGRGELAVDLNEGRKHSEDEEEANEERLRKQGWYLGRGTEDVARAILLGGARSNTFTVYKDQNNDLNYTLSARFQVEGVANDIVEHLRIMRTEEGLFQIQGETAESCDIVETISCYVTNRHPPLTPALGKSFETQLSIPDDPPSYTQADRVLAPDLTPLPNVTSIKIESAKEAKAGSLGGSVHVSRGEIQSDSQFPSHVYNPHWYRYQNHCCLHPKNCYHCCCYRDTYWTGSREAYSNSWYSLKGTGPLRLLGLLVMYIICGPCLLCCVCCYFLFFMFLASCVDLDDD